VLILLSAIGAKLDYCREMDFVELIVTRTIAHLVDVRSHTRRFMDDYCLWKSPHGPPRNFRYQADLLRHSGIE
jgi:hypothetical protein